MLEIALQESGNGVYQKDISIRQKISVKYLDNIISSLKTAGLITTIRGKKSGYKLTRDADSIKILDIYKAFEPGVEVVDCINRNFDCEMSATCCVRNFWNGLNKTIVDYFDSYTLGDLIAEHKKKTEALLS